jgi:prepilin-type processing-associated H-X9-DG protein
MYKIIGADGKEYGPITANQLRQWIAQGRAHAATKVRPEESAEWQTLGSLPDFAEALAQPPSIPNLPSATVTPAKTSGMAIASLVLGMLGIACGLTAVVGLVLGILALTQINKSQGQLAGKGLAIAGIVVSSLLLAFSLLILPAMLLPALAKAKAKAQSITCMNNVKQINLAILVRAQAHTNTCLPAATWCDAIQSELTSDKVLQCDAGDKTRRSHYAFNAKLDGLSMDQIKNPAQTVMVFETDGGWNLSGGSELQPQKPRHGRMVAVGFVDGHVEMVEATRLAQLQWEP